MKKLLLVIGLFTLVGCSKEPIRDPVEPVSKATDEKNVVDKNEAAILVDKIQSIPTLEQAIQVSIGMMDDSFNKMPTAAMFIPLWAEKNKIDLGMINAITSTSYGKIMKDSSSERGKSFCVTGMVGDIAVDRSAGFAVYTGGIVTNDMRIVRYIAMKSTGDIVDGSMSKFCGIVVGKIKYENARGGTTHAPYLVGMFNLPENK
ncbi:hypothetical protein RMB13_08960 [Acinetobacter sp. V102_4]|uniref:hypothetical protein n=1 Tax=Acinetobacter sp. V102_4 TaxID=3072984 RepID=UPI00287CD313|nr:hypothetical protein [Acinetobacter sp. V102_4]MDS7929607.1 hypothetical protein [Acinetobacter sp. V102_4]